MAIAPMRRAHQPNPHTPPAPPGTNDLLLGDAANNVLIGGTGNDTLNGDAGTDTADYSRLANGVTLFSQGVVGKGAAGTDLLIGIERIIGAVGKANLIDGTVTNPATQTTSFEVDLGGPFAHGGSWSTAWAAGGPPPPPWPVWQCPGLWCSRWWRRSRPSRPRPSNHSGTEKPIPATPATNQPNPSPA